MPFTVLKLTMPASNGLQTQVLDHIVNWLLPFALFSHDTSCLFET